mmetsp:Transcript_11034/g.25684  ORF Transcript_11034/g.25684 Transcript_11034/m.25684 type:complete len:106 (-) Transcript_11034:29-346(-)
MDNFMSRTDAEFRVCEWRGERECDNIENDTTKTGRNQVDRGRNNIDIIDMFETPIALENSDGGSSKVCVLSIAPSFLLSPPIFHAANDSQSRYTISDVCHRTADK